MNQQRGKMFRKIGKIQKLLLFFFNSKKKSNTNHSGWIFLKSVLKLLLFDNFSRLSIELLFVCVYIVIRYANNVRWIFLSGLQLEIIFFKDISKILRQIHLKYSEFFVFLLESVEIQMVAGYQKR